MFGRGKGKEGPRRQQAERRGGAQQADLGCGRRRGRPAEPADDEFLEDDELLEGDELLDGRGRGRRAGRADARPAPGRPPGRARTAGRRVRTDRLEPVAIYGPRGEDVAAVLDALSEIDEDRARAARRRLDGRRSRPSATSWSGTCSIAAVDGQHRYELSAAEDSVTAWLNSLKLEDDDEAALWTVVADAARGAVEALILDEDLDDADYDMLYGPWAAGHGRARTATPLRPGIPGRRPSHRASSGRTRNSSGSSWRSSTSSPPNRRQS